MVILLAPLQVSSQMRREAIDLLLGGPDGHNLQKPIHRHS
jgi:hypothetical protein